MSDTGIARRQYGVSDTPYWRLALGFSVGHWNWEREQYALECRNNTIYQLNALSKLLSSAPSFVDKLEVLTETRSSETNCSASASP